MRSIYPLIFILLSCGSALAQVGIGTTTPNVNAVLELRSPGNDQGLLVPRLTTIQRTAMALSSAEDGMMVYDIEEQKFYYWQGTQWLPIRSGLDVNYQAGAGISITGNTISSIPDGDGSATNEIQDLQINGNTLSITNNTSATTVDLAPFVGTNTDNQTLTFNGTTGDLSISGGNTAVVTAAGPAGGALSGNYPSPGIATDAGNSLLTALNDATTTSVLQANRLDAAVVLDTESPGGGVISGNFSGGLQINDNAITSTKILDAAVTSAKLSSTGVVANTYGSATLVPTFTVDAKGRIISARNVPVSGGGSAEGLAETLAAGNDGKLQSAVNLSAISVNRADVPGALNVNGSHYMSFTMFDDGYVVQPDDYILINNGGTLKPVSIELPPAAENAGRVLIIRSQARDLNEAVTVSAPDGIDGFTTSEPLYMEVNFSNNTAYTITVISTGKTWLTIDRGLASTFNKG